MRRIDFYVQHLVRHNAQEIELCSGKPVRFVFASGDKTSSSPIEHAQISQLVQEAAPVTAMEALRRDGVVSFKDAAAGVKVLVTVEASSKSDWRVSLVPVGSQTAIPQARTGARPPAVPAAPPAPRPSAASPARSSAASPARRIAVPLDPAQEAMPEAVFERPLGGMMAGEEGTGSVPIQRPASPVESARAPQKKQSVPPPSIQSVPGEPAINRYLREMVRLGASDLHLSSTVEPMIRLDGEMRALEGRGPMQPEELQTMLMEIAPERNVTEFEETWDTDFAHTIEGLARFRANIFIDRKGPGAVFRQIPFEILTVEQLGLPQGVVDLCWLSKGLVLVTGPTGSGKSTTLASLIDFINENRTDHIITIEDPIEFVHDNKNCLLNQREVGTHTKTFKAALRAALREDPDIVLVGEMRDLETIAIAIETAETGHLVFGTLHTTSAKSTVDRIIDQFPADQQEQIRVMLSESLRGVIAQVLCKKNGGGRVAGYEVMITNPAVSNLIREGKTYQLTSVMQTGKNLGMQTMNDHLLAHVKSGLVDAEEAYIKSNDKQQFKEMLQRNNVSLNLG
ncbi:MAG: type IV pilus twitching motility protein PilT [Myxococcota bacterium]